MQDTRELYRGVAGSQVPGSGFTVHCLISSLQLSRETEAQGP